MKLTELIPPTVDIVVAYNNIFSRVYYLRSDGTLYKKGYRETLFNSIPEIQEIALDSVIFFDDKWEQIK